LLYLTVDTLLYQSRNNIHASYFTLSDGLVTYENTKEEFSWLSTTELDHAPDLISDFHSIIQINLVCYPTFEFFHSVVFSKNSILFITPFVFQYLLSSIFLSLISFPFYSLFTIQDTQTFFIQTKNLYKTFLLNYFFAFSDSDSKPESDSDLSGFSTAFSDSNSDCSIQSTTLACSGYIISQFYLIYLQCYGQFLKLTSLALSITSSHTFIHSTRHVVPK
jgi:hypothetical protein